MELAELYRAEKKHCEALQGFCDELIFKIARLEDEAEAEYSDEVNEAFESKWFNTDK